MAKYLSEEDMNTGEYISRDVALRQLNATCLATDCNNYNGVMCRACAYADAMDFIDAIPAADVQPIDRWISVKDRLPDEGQKCLVYRDIDADLKITTGIWHSEWKAFDGLRHGTRLEDAIAWQPLPEPPKDGDAE
jgi:hypothetical protein